MQPVHRVHFINLLSGKPYRNYSIVAYIKHSGQIFVRTLSDVHFFLQMTYVSITPENSRAMLFRKDFMCIASKSTGKRNPSVSNSCVSFLCASCALELKMHFCVAGEMV